MKLKLHKKGSIFETLNLLIIFTVLTFVVLAFTIMWFETGEALDAASAELNNEHFTTALNNTYQGPAGAYAPIADWGMILLLFGVMIAVIVVAYLLNNNPIFTWIYVIIGMIMVFVSIFLANGAYAALTIEGMTEYSDMIPKTVWVFEHLLEITIVWVTLVGVALFTKRPEEPQFGGGVGF